jgi:hypothetical protein
MIDSEARVLLSTRARDDFLGLPESAARSVRTAFDRLGNELDEVELELDDDVGALPDGWYVVRVSGGSEETRESDDADENVDVSARDLLVVFRPVRDQEIEPMNAAPSPAILVARIVTLADALFLRRTNASTVFSGAKEESAVLDRLRALVKDGELLQAVASSRGPQDGTLNARLYDWHQYIRQTLGVYPRYLQLVEDAAREPLSGPASIDAQRSALQSVIDALRGEFQL